MGKTQGLFAWDAYNGVKFITKAVQNLRGSCTLPFHTATCSDPKDEAHPMPPEQKNVPGATMKYWLASTLKDLREDAGVSFEAVAARSKRIGGPGHSQVSRFESHESWPREFDQVVAAYAAELGLNDCRELWQRALDRWYEHGTIQREASDGSYPPSKRFADLIEAQTRRDRERFRPERRAAPSATKKRRAAG